MNARTKAPTGIAGFDEITGGGLPRGRTTLLVGGPGSGKTIFALQFLVHGARDCKEPGIFVAFEETSKRIVANAEGFGWKLAELRRKKKLFFMDAQPTPDLIQVGKLRSRRDAGGPRTPRSRKWGRGASSSMPWISYWRCCPISAAKRREIYRLHQWLLARELTASSPRRPAGMSPLSIGQQPFGFMQFMVDCAVILNHRVVTGRVATQSARAKIPRLQLR